MLTFSFSFWSLFFVGFQHHWSQSLLLGSGIRHSRKNTRIDLINVLLIFMYDVYFLLFILQDYLKSLNFSSIPSVLPSIVLVIPLGKLRIFQGNLGFLQDNLGLVHSTQFYWLHRFRCTKNIAAYPNRVSLSYIWPNTTNVDCFIWVRRFI